VVTDRVYARQNAIAEGLPVALHSRRYAINTVEGDRGM
jgi:hypothetical protein